MNKERSEAQRLLDLFHPPFKCDEEKIYIFDAKNHMMVSEWRGHLAARGWGRIKYLKNGARVFDAWELAFEEIVGAETNITKAAELLNRAWEKAS